jgi:hypothetical protein
MGFCWLITVWGNDEKSEHYRHAGKAFRETALD